MAEYVVTIDGVMETANGRSRVAKGQTVSLTDWEYAHNTHLFGVALPATVEFVLPPDSVTVKVVSVKPAQSKKKRAR